MSKSVFTAWMFIRSNAGQIDVCKDGAGIAFSEELAKVVLGESEIEVVVTLRDGDAAARAFGCDLTYDYVKLTAITELKFIKKRAFVYENFQ